MIQLPYAEYRRKHQQRIVVPKRGAGGVAAVVFRFRTTSSNGTTDTPQP